MNALKWGVVVALALASFAAPVRAANDGAARPSIKSVLGWWHGKSDCVVKGGPCHDEIVQYHFEPIADQPDSLRLTADKVVAGRFETMGVFNVGYSPARRTWAAEFSNSRVHVLWSYRIRGRELIGTLFGLTDSSVLRHASLTRGPGVVPR